MKERNIKKYIWIASIILIFYFLIILAGNIISVGEKLGKVHIYLEIGFYVLTFGLLLWLISMPFFWMARKPHYDYSLIMKDGQKASKEDLVQIREKLLSSLDLNSEGRKSLENCSDEELEEKERLVLGEIGAEVEEYITNTALVVFLTVAISSNGLLDGLTVLYYNMRMIGKIISSYGIRPSAAMIFTLARNVFLTAFVVNRIEELDIEEYIEEALESFGDVAASKLVSKLADSLIQGIMSAFVTLKVGYASKQLILYGESENRSEFKRRIRRKARGALAMQVLPKSLKAVPSGLGKLVSHIIKKLQKSNEVQVSTK